MTMFQKPKVAIAFTPAGEVEEAPALQQPVEHWAHTPARRWALATLLTFLCVCAFAYPTYNSDLLPGDDATVRTNAVFAQLRNPRNMQENFWHDVDGLKIIWTSPYKLPELSPVSYTVLLFEHQFFWEHPRGYHIISLLLHARNALLLWLLLRRLELPGAWLGAALFALHPVQVDAVSWISQQRYLICGAFYLCALLVYLRRVGLNPQPDPPLPGAEPLIHIGLPENPKALYILSIMLFVLALLSHVVGATFPLVVLVMIWWEQGKIKREDVIPLVPFALLSAAFSVLAAMLAYHRTGKLWIEFPGAVNWIVVWGRGIWTYFLMTILPIGLAFARPRWTAASMPLWNWIYPLSAIFVVGALWALRRRWGRGPITAALLFICLLIPSALGASDANDSDLPGVMVREHVLYLACCAVLVPLATLLCGALSSSKLTRKLSAVPGVVMAMTPVVSLMILVPLAIATFIHAAAYNDVKSLWENVLHGNGDSVVALNTLGQLDLDAKDYNSAEYHFLAALRADPDDAQSLLNLARVAESQQQFDEAIARYDEVLVPHPDNVSAHFGLAAALAGQGNTSAALAEYASVLKLDPRNVSVMNNIGLIYAGQGRVDDAIAEYQKAISTDGRSIMAYLNMANSLFQEGKLSDARDTLAKAIEIEPRNPIIWLNAGVMAEAVGDVKSAEKYFRWAIFYKFDSADAFNNLGMLLMREGDAPGRTDHVGEAIYDFKRAAELDPNNASLYEQSRMAALRRKDAILQQQQQR